MDLEQLSLEQRQQIAEFIGIEQEFADHPERLETFLTSFDQNRLFTAPPTTGTGQSLEDFQAQTAEEDVTPETPKSRLWDIARRANTGTLGAEEILMAEMIASNLYDPNNIFTVDGVLSTDEITTLTNISQEPLDARSAEISGRLTLDYNERAALYEEEMQPALAVQTKLAALGHIEVSDIGNISEEAIAEILVDLTAANGGNSYGFRMSIEYSLPGNIYDIRHGMFEDSANGDWTVTSTASAVLDVALEGRQFSQIVERALQEDATPQEIQMAQGLVGARITIPGEWDTVALDKAQEYLEQAATSGFPDNMVSFQRGEVVDVSYVTEALQNGTLRMPEGADLDAISSGLSEMSESAQITMVANWLTDADNYEANHATYAQMFEDQTISSEIQTQIGVIRADITARMEQEAVAESAAAHFDAAAMSSVGIRGFGETYESIQADIERLDNAELAQSLVDAGDYEGAMEVALASVNTTISDLETAQIEEVASHIHAYQSWSAFEDLSAEDIVIQLRNPEVRQEIETAWNSGRIRERLENKFDRFESARIEQLAVKERILEASGQEEAPEETTPEIDPSTDAEAPALVSEVVPETPVEALLASLEEGGLIHETDLTDSMADPQAYLEERGLIGNYALLARPEVDPADSMAELQAYLDGIAPADRIVADNAIGIEEAATGTPLTGAEPVVDLENGSIPFAGAADPAAVVVAENTVPTNAPRPMALE